MGRLVEGRWSTEWYDTRSTGGRFVRTDAGFRNWITPDGSAGPSGVGGFPAAAGRYALIVSYACPWAHRTLIFRRLKGLEEIIPVAVVAPRMPAETGWTFTLEGAEPNPAEAAEHLWQVYVEAEPSYSGRVTVPVLWDRQQRTIVSNESAEIIRMFNSAFDELTGNTDDYYPEPLRQQIDETNARVYRSINNGVYRAGFATTQEAYDEAVVDLFAALDWVEQVLGETAYLCGDVATEADWRLFTTLVRFDAVYYSHFKCNMRQIADYPNISQYIEALYNVPGIAETVRLDHIKTHYYWSHDQINPTRIVPMGPTPAFLR